MPMSASQTDIRPSLVDYWKGLKVQARVLNALMIRELMMRYGRGNIGFLWLIVEPMILWGRGPQAAALPGRARQRAASEARQLLKLHPAAARTKFASSPQDL
jgi:hypothetical protein